MSATKKQTVSKPAAVKAKTAARRKAGKAAKANSRRKAKVEVKPGYGGVGYFQPSGGKGYKGHRIGSRKERVHKAFDRSGEKAAEQCARRAGIAKATLKAWLYAFGHQGEGGDEE